MLRFEHSWRVLFDETEVAKPIGLGISYTRSLKDTLEVFANDGKTRIRVEQNHEHGVAGVVWDAGICMVGIIHRLKELHDAKSVLELGSGTGLVGVAVKRLFPKLRLVITDRTERDTALIKKNLAHNLPTCVRGEESVCVREIEWGRPQDADALRPRTFDVVLCSDTVYEKDALDAFLQTLEMTTRRGSVVFLAYRRRFDARERPFFRLLSNNFVVTVAAAGPLSDEGDGAEDDVHRNVHFCKCIRK